jgi:hypothetical protein
VPVINRVRCDWILNCKRCGCRSVEEHTLLEPRTLEEFDPYPIRTQEVGHALR